MQLNSVGIISIGFIILIWGLFIFIQNKFILWVIINTVPIDQQYTVKIDYKPYNYFKDIDPECFDKTDGRKENHLDDYPKENDYFKDDPYYACAYCKNYDCMNCKIYPM